MEHRKHPVPAEYHELFAIGQTDRRGNIIDFKTPPVIVDSVLSMEAYKELIFREHISAETLSLSYTDPKRFIILRPTALPYRIYVREQLQDSGLKIYDEFELDNFMKFADIVYLLDPSISFHWKWRVIMRTLHEGTQDQNKAVVYMLEDSGEIEQVMSIKKRIRTDMGETPVLVRYDNAPEIALGIHHLHSPDLDRLAIEYNVLMHAKHKTSVFAY